jgi:two-component system sensor histidine kinase/response regulator
VGVAGGAPALQALQDACAAQEPFRLILLDARMPEMDGFTLAERIKEHPEYNEAAVMMLTSDNQAGDIARCRDLGLAAHLIKPIQRAELHDTIMMALDFSFDKFNRPTQVASTAPQAPHRPLHILLAEDNIVNQQVAVRMLGKQGHTVEVARNGREALAALERQSFDLLLLDVQMPEVGGFEVAQMVRQREHGTDRHLPIIALTAHAMTGDRDRCLEAGMDDYVSKPVQFAELQTTIDELLGEATIHPALVSPVRPPAGSVIDTEGLWQRVDRDHDFLHELVDLFAADAPRQLKLIREAIACGDADSVQRASHTLKGSVSNFCAAEAFEAARRLELQGRTGSLAGAEKLFTDLEGAIGRVHTALQRLMTLDQDSPSPLGQSA